jgi:hypothetical protein
MDGVHVIIDAHRAIIGTARRSPGDFRAMNDLWPQRQAARLEGACALGRNGVAGQSERPYEPICAGRYRLALKCLDAPPKQILLEQREAWRRARQHLEAHEEVKIVDVDYTVCADYYKGDPNGGYHAFVYTDHLSSEQIVALRTQVEEEVRAKLNIKFNPSTAALRYEHSMGQGLPDFIHRKATGRSAPKPMTPARPDLQHFPSGHVARRVVSERDDLVD